MLLTLFLTIPLYFCLQFASYTHLFLSFDERWLYLLKSENRLDSISLNQYVPIVVTVIIAIMIPVAIFLMERKELYGFDRRVILDKVVLGKVFVPLLLITPIISFVGVSLITAIVSFSLLLVTFVVLKRSYSWMSSYETGTSGPTYRQGLRLKFLGAIKNSGDIVDVWTLILNDKDLREKDQAGFVEKFIYVLNALKKNGVPEDKRHKHTLLALFNHNLDKVDLADYNIYESLVSYSIYGFSLNRSNRFVNPPERYWEYEQERLARNLLEIALTNEDLYSYIYFTEISKRIKDIDDKKRAVWIANFFPTYLKTLEMDERYDPKSLWYVLKDWEVTSESLSDESRVATSRALLDAYMNWIRKIIQSANKLTARESDVIAVVTEKLFPKIVDQFWYDVIAFFEIGIWGVEPNEDGVQAHIREYLERRRVFRVFSRSLTYNLEDTSYEKDYIEREPETIAILNALYPKHTGLLNGYLDQALAQIKIIKNDGVYEKESYEYVQLESLERRFLRIKKLRVS